MKSRLQSGCPSVRATVLRLAAVSFSAGWAALFGLTALTVHAASASEAAPSAIVVSGTSEVFAAPDRAMVSLGAVVEAKQALDAQKQLAQDEKIRTAGLSLNPIYSHPVPKAGQEPETPRIAGYRASNTVRVQVDDLERVGIVIDAGIAAGANQLAGLVFDIRDDLKYRRQALQLAAQEARSKAEALASALNLQLGEVLEIREEGGPAVYPVERRFAAPAAAGTPVQPGQVQVNAGVSVRFKLVSPSK